MEPLDVLGLGPEGLEDTVGVVRLDPGGEEASWNREVREVVDRLLEFHAGEPGIEHILAHRCFEPRPHAGKEVCAAATGAAVFRHVL
jgi:hypothetical protein